MNIYNFCFCLSLCSTVMQTLCSLVSAMKCWIMVQHIISGLLKWILIVLSEHPSGRKENLEMGLSLLTRHKGAHLAYWPISFKLWPSECIDRKCQQWLSKTGHICNSQSLFAQTKTTGWKWQANWRKAAFFLPALYTP